jgi:hypothetical protein
MASFSGRFQRLRLWDSLIHVHEFIQAHHRLTDLPEEMAAGAEMGVGFGEEVFKIHG